MEDLAIWKIIHKPLLALPWPNMAPKFYYFSDDKAYRISHFYGLLTSIFWIIVAIVAIVLLIPNYTFWLNWVLAGIAITPGIIKLITLIIKIIRMIRVKNFSAYFDERVRVIVVDGKVGAGKTSSLLECYALFAKQMWSKLCRQASKLLPYENEIQFWEDKLRIPAQEILESHHFFTEAGTVPLLYTSVPAIVDGKFTNKLTAKHLEQKSRLPFGSIIVIDEISNVLPQKLYQGDSLNIAEFFKYIRHLFDGYVGATEQDKNSNWVVVRRNTGKVVHIIEQETVGKSLSLEWLYNKLEKHYSKHLTKPKIAKLYKFKKIVDNSGYRKFYYKEYYDGEDTKERKPIKNFITKPALDIIYDNRAYRNKYQCLNKKLEVTAWDNLVLSKEDLKEVFSEDVINMTKSKKQLKEEAKQRRLEKEQNIV